MYSVVLLAALTAGANSPACHKWGGYACSGCYGYSCGGCYGCYGGGWYGGCGCWGCAAGPFLGMSCYGCYGFYAQYPSYGYGGCYCAGPFQCHGCYGCYGCYGCHGMPPVVQPLGIPVVPGTAKPDETAPPPKKTSATSSPAKLLVELPADAKLFVDDQLMKTNSERREFNTPSLEKGSTYYYILRVEVVRDGKTISETKRILVRAGDQVKASFSEEGLVAASRKDSGATATADAGR